MVSVKHIPLLVNGKEDTNNNAYEVFSHDEEPQLLCKASCVQVEDVGDICKTAMTGFKKWSSMSVFDRMKILQKATNTITACNNELVESFHEMGLPSWFSQFNSSQVVEQLEEYIHQMSNTNGEVLQTGQVDLSITVHQPVGPVLAIAPWNAPGILTGRTIFAPLAAGCSVILKSSELAPQIGFLLVKCLYEAGVPQDVVQLVNVKPEDNKGVVKAFIEHPNVRKVSFTGSTATGKQIASVAAANLKPCVLELGGKNCTIITEDADISKAVGATLWASWGHKGQICMSTDKIYVHESISDKFDAEVAATAPNLLEDKEYFLPQRHVGFAKSVHALIDDALAKGAKIVYGEKTAFEESKNSPISPLVLGGVTPAMKIHTQEVFGPVVCVYKYRDVDEVVDTINGEQYGLKSSIWSKNVLKAQRLARRIEAGGVHINSPTIFDEKTAPHGGVKESGYGRFNSKWGLNEFTYVKTITMCE